MGMYFSGHGGFCLNASGWVAIYDLARDFGWEPAGTVAGELAAEEASAAPASGTAFDPELSNQQSSQESPPKRFSYFCSAGQLVTKEDAAALASALRKALTKRSADPASLPDISDEDAAHIEEFIAYSSKGEFRID